MRYKDFFKANFIIFTLLFLSFSQAPKAQILESTDKNYYSLPVNIRVLLSGNFAELRPNHFHGGIDIKTQGRIGLPIFASADGYVSRISVSPTGYGKVLYLNHPNGTTTVYGHLDSFSEKIDSYVKKVQYEKESFAVDISIPEGVLAINKVEQIAKGGNSGSSAGPHLHYEIRNTKEQKVLNPLLFFNVTDNTKPLIQSVAIYPVESGSSVNRGLNFQKFETILINNTYELKQKSPILVSGGIGFGIQTIDLLDGSHNKCGIYSIKLIVDTVLIYSFTMNEFYLNETKYINSHTDYSLAYKTGIKLYKTWIEPGNKLSIYETIKNNGIYTFDDEKNHDIKYEVTDLAGNKSTVKFKVQSVKNEIQKVVQSGEFFKYSKDNKLKEDDIVFSIPEGSLYSSIYFEYKSQNALANTFSPVYQLHKSSVPLHIPCNLRIRAKKIPIHLHDKLMLAQVEPKTGRVYSATGKYSDGWVEGNIRAFGFYTIIADTIAPIITPIIFNEQKTLIDPNAVKFKISDKTSGIQSYRGTIDGNWVLFEYDLKNNIISYTFDKARMKFGINHKLHLEVSDFKGNKSVYTTNFFK